jgi:hypothetical protein
MIAVLYPMFKGDRSSLSRFTEAIAVSYPVLKSDRYLLLEYG